jgi:hypothetical protein
MLETIAEDVDQWSRVTRSMQEEIPWAKPCHSREQVALFFKELLDTVQPEKFEIFNFLSVLYFRANRYRMITSIKYLEKI